MQKQTNIKKISYESGQKNEGIAKNSGKTPPSSQPIVLFSKINKN